MNEQTSLLSVSLLQVLRMVHFLRKCTMRKTCKKSFRSPKATMLRDRRARLNESIAPTDPQAQDLGACLVLIMGTPALVAAVNAIDNWLQKRRSASLTSVTTEKKIVAENLTNKDAAQLLHLFLTQNVEQKEPSP